MHDPTPPSGASLALARSEMGDVVVDGTIADPEDLAAAEDESDGVRTDESDGEGRHSPTQRRPTHDQRQHGEALLTDASLSQSHDGLLLGAALPMRRRSTRSLLHHRSFSIATRRASMKLPRIDSPRRRPSNSGTTTTDPSEAAQEDPDSHAKTVGAHATTSNTAATAAVAAAATLWRRLRIYCEVVRLLYYLVTIPMRFGLFYDPQGLEVTWSTSLGGWIAADVLVDGCGLVCRLHRPLPLESTTGEDDLDFGDGGDGRGQRGSLDAKLVHAMAIVGKARGERPSWPYIIAPTLVRDNGDVLSLKNGDAQGENTSPNRIPWMKLGHSLAQLVVFFPFEIPLAVARQWNLMHVFRLTKILALADVPRVVEVLKFRWIHMHVVQWLLERVLRRVLVGLILIAIVWMHWSALIYLLIAHNECGLAFDRCENASMSWASRDQLQGSPPSRAYARAMYWASRTIITLGFSDAVATTNGETFFTVIAEFLGAFWCASVIAAWAYWFSSMQSAEHAHELFMHRVKRFLRGRPGQYLATRDDASGIVDAGPIAPVPRQLQSRILAFLAFQWKTTREFTEAEFRAVLQQEQLQHRLRRQLKTSRLLQLPCLAQQSLGFVNAVAERMHLEILAPLDWVLEYPDTEQRLVVILFGAVAVISPGLGAQDQRIHLATAGESFGAITLFEPGLLRERAFAETFVELLVLPVQELDGVLSSYYPDKDIASRQRDEMHAAARVEYIDFKTRRAATPSKTEAVDGSHRDAVQRELERSKKWPHRTSPLRVYWDILHGLALLYVAFEVPYVFVFSFGDRGTFGGWAFDLTFSLSLVVECFFYADIYYRLTAPQFSSAGGSSIYRRVGCLVDIVAAVPLAVILDVLDGAIGLPASLHWLSVLRLLRLLRLHRLHPVVRRVLHRWTGATQFIVYCVLAILTYNHLVGCIWYLVGHVSLDAKNVVVPDSAPSWTRTECIHMAEAFANCSWTLMDGHEGPTASRPRAYLRALYFSISTFTTVAYGDILPYSVSETWLANAATFVGGTLCYAVIGAMGAAIARLAARRRGILYEEHLVNRIWGHHGQEKITSAIRTRVQRFQRFKHQTLRQQTLERTLFGSLSRGLRRELSAHLYLPMVGRIGFMLGASDAFCTAIAGKMSRRFYYEGEQILRAGAIAPEVIVLRAGRVRQRDPRSWLLIDEITSSGFTFGEVSFLTQTQPVQYFFETSAVTETVTLEHRGWNEVLEHFPHEQRRLSKWNPLSTASTSFAEIVVARCSGDPPAPADARLGRITFGSTRLPTMALSRRSRQRQLNGAFRLIWELVIGHIVIYNCFLIVTRLAFWLAPSSRAMLALTAVDYVLDLALLVDIVLKSTVFLPQSDRLSTRVYARAEIWANYRQNGWCLVDVVASAPLYYVGEDFALMTLCRVPRLLRAVQLPEIAETIQLTLTRSLLLRSRFSYSVVGLVKVLFIFLLSCHVGGSVYFAIADVEASPTNWVATDIVTTTNPGDPFVAYVRAFYWSMSSFTVINYGDIVATTTRETLWACVICLFGTLFMSQVGGEIVDILSNLDRTASAHREHVEHFYRLAQQRGLPRALVARAARCMDFQFDVFAGLGEATEELFRSLPRGLREEVAWCLHGPALRGLPLFASFREDQLRALAALWHPHVYLPGEVLFHERTRAERVGLVRRGTVEIAHLESQFVLGTVGTGQLVGEHAFFAEHALRLVSYRALTYCELLQLHREQWEGDFVGSLRHEDAVEALNVAARAEYDATRATWTRIFENLGMRSLVPSSTGSRTSRDAAATTATSSNKLTRVFRPSCALLLDAPLILGQATATSDHPLDTDAVTYSQISSNRSRNASQSSWAASQDSSDEAEADYEEVATPPDRAQARPRRRRQWGSMPAIAAPGTSSSGPDNRSSRRISHLGIAATRPPAIASDGEQQPETRGMTPVDQHHHHHRHPLAIVDHLDTPETREDPSSSSSGRFEEHSAFRYRWDGAKFLATLYYALAIPLRVAFYHDIIAEHGSETFMHAWIALEYLVDAFFLVDMYLRLERFSPVVRGTTITDARARRRWYVRHGGFVTDALGSFPFEALALLPSSHADANRATLLASILRMETLVRCFQLESLWRRLERYYFYERPTLSLHQDAIALLKILFIAIVSSHWIACLWFYTGRAAMPVEPTSWLGTPFMLVPGGLGGLAELDAVPLRTKYLRAYHYAIGSISTVTYGDICSRNLIETLEQLVITFLCLVFYGYVTGGFRRILTRQLEATLALEARVARIRQFGLHHRLSEAFAFRVCAQLQRRRNAAGDVGDGPGALRLLTPGLGREVACFVRRRLLVGRSSPFAGLPTVLVARICAELREELFSTEDVIYEQFSTGRCLYIVETGGVVLTTVAHGDHTTADRRCGPLAVFGERCVLARNPEPTRGETAIAAEASCLVILGSDALTRLAADAPEYVEMLRARWLS